MKTAVIVWVSVPFVAVIITWNRPGLVLVQERLAVASGGTDTLVGLRVLHERPVGTVSERDMVPANPLSPVRVIVEIEEVPGLAVGLEAEIVKSIMLNVIVFER